MSTLTASGCLSRDRAAKKARDAAKGKLSPSVVISDYAKTRD